MSFLIQIHELEFISLYEKKTNLTLELMTNEINVTALLEFVMRNAGIKYIFP
jgi:hypothetical protein